MPELPEVEIVRRSLEPRITGRLITFIRGETFADVMGPGGLERSSELLGRRVVGIDRRGKYLIVGLDDGAALVVHLRMTGQLVVAEPGDPTLRFQHLVIGLVQPVREGSALSVVPDPATDLIELRYADQRKFGRVLHVDPDARSALFPDMGPEPLDPAFTPMTLIASLDGRRAPIKNVLLDQRRVAGLGNIYVDEALFRSGIHPLRPAGSLTAAETTRLHGGIVTVLEESLARRGTTFSSFLDGYGRRGDNGDNLRVYGRGRQNLPCPVCGAPLRWLRLAGRSSSYCPVCQPLGSGD